MPLAAGAYDIAIDLDPGASAVEGAHVDAVAESGTLNLGGRTVPASQVRGRHDQVHDRAEAADLGRRDPVARAGWVQGRNPARNDHRAVAGELKPDRGGNREVLSL